jgi:hypothetical protein
VKDNDGREKRMEKPEYKKALKYNNLRALLANFCGEGGK